MDNVFLSDLNNKITPYTAGEQPTRTGFIKLNTNESPYPPSKKVKRALNKFNYKTLRRYPLINADEIRELIAKKEGVNAENVFCGNGSDEILAFCFPTFFNPNGKNVVFPNITYTFYSVYANFFGVNYKTIPLKENFTIDKNDYMGISDCQGIIIANPNAPTAIAMSLIDIEDIVRANLDKVVIIDEAYIDFHRFSAVKLLENYKNLLIVKTFSKGYALAGIRFGYALGDKTLIDGLFKTKDSFNSYPVDSVCQAVCKACLEDLDYYKKMQEKIIRGRDKLTAGLKLLGFSVLPSRANFVFCTKNDFSAKELYLKLKEKNIFVRHFDKPLISEYLRITVGTEKQIDVLLENIKSIIGV